MERLYFVCPNTDRTIDVGIETELETLLRIRSEHLRIACPHCGEQIHEDAQRCPHCEQYISQEDAPSARKPWWVVAGVIVCLYVVLRWIIW